MTLHWSVYEGRKNFQSGYFRGYIINFYIRRGVDKNDVIWILKNLIENQETKKLTDAVEILVTEPPLLPINDQYQISQFLAQVSTPEKPHSQNS